jgi:hypothetical protein
MKIFRPGGILSIKTPFLKKILWIFCKKKPSVFLPVKNAVIIKIKKFV